MRVAVRRFVFRAQQRCIDLVRRGAAVVLGLVDEVHAELAPRAHRDGLGTLAELGDMPLCGVLGDLENLAELRERRARTVDQDLDPRAVLAPTSAVGFMVNRTDVLSQIHVRWGSYTLPGLTSTSSRFLGSATA